MAQKLGPALKNLWVPLERDLCGHLLAGLLWEKQFESVLVGNGWEKAPALECFFAHRQMGLFLSVNVDDIKMAGKRRNLVHMWKSWMKQVNLETHTTFLDQMYLGCSQRE